MVRVPSSSSGTRSRTISLLLILISTLSISRASTTGHFDLGLSSRAVQSEAICLDTFSWMDNSLQQSPCIVAGYLLSACAGGNWNVQPVTASSHYTPPSEANANGCRCSWAAYNTLQACADCQGQNFESAIRSWSGYNVNCTGSLLSNTSFYPEDTPIPAETAIPVWATTDPSNWHDAIFDPSMAQSIANENNADITQSTRSSNENKKSSNTGAIAGGVVGGIVGVLLLGALFLYLRRRRRLATKSDLIEANNPNRRRGTVRFSPIAHMRTGSGGSSSPSAQPFYSKFIPRWQGHGDGGGYNVTPSPGPTMMSVPMSMSMENTGSTGTANGRPPFVPMHSSSSFTATATASPPPGEYITHTQPGKYGTMTSMPMVTMNNPSNVAFSNSVSSAYATGAPSSIAPVLSHGHSHTLSNDSAAFSMAGGGAEPPEGTIVPFVLPALPEPVGLADAASGPGIVRSSTPSKSTHGRGPSDASTGSGDVFSSPLVGTNAALGMDMGTGGRRPPPERRNPPAYTALSPGSPPSVNPALPPGIAFDSSPSPDHSPGLEGVLEGEEGEGGDMRSVEAQRAETTLSGTTLRGRSGTGAGSSAQAPTLAGDANEGERDQHGYPSDRKL